MPPSSAAAGTSVQVLVHVAEGLLEAERDEHDAGHHRQVQIGERVARDGVLLAPRRRVREPPRGDQRDDVEVQPEERGRDDHAEDRRRPRCRCRRGRRCRRRSRRSTRRARSARSARSARRSGRARASSPRGRRTSGRPCRARAPAARPRPATSRGTSRRSGARSRARCCPRGRSPTSAARGRRGCRG